MVLAIRDTGKWSRGKRIPVDHDGPIGRMVTRLGTKRVCFEHQAWHFMTPPCPIPVQESSSILATKGHSRRLALT